MGERVYLTALVTGLPRFIHGPQLRNSETELQFLVHHYPVEWENCVANLREEHGVSERICFQLRSLKIRDIDDPVVKTEVEEWVNWRLPTSYRTLKSLCKVRDLRNYEELLRKYKIYGKVFGSKREHEEYVNFLGFELIQILWPREKDPSGDTSTENMATSMGVEVVPLETDASRELNLVMFLPHVKGAFLWLVPGGSEI